MTEKITVTASIAASPAKVWDYYTQAAHIVNWNFADPSWHCPRASNDLKAGGKYFARMEARDASFGFDFEAVYTSVDEGKAFSYAFGGRVAEVVLSPKGDFTEISVSFDPEEENSLELQRAGWQAILNNFKAYTERN